MCVYPLGYLRIRRSNLVSDDGLTAVPLSVLTAYYATSSLADLCLADESSLFLGVWTEAASGGLTMRKLTVESLSRFPPLPTLSL